MKVYRSNKRRYACNECEQNTSKNLICCGDIKTRATERNNNTDEDVKMLTNVSPSQMTLKTALGQALDLLSCPPGQKPILKKFTMERYNAIVKYKTSFYSFYLPIALSMYMVSDQILCFISNLGVWKSHFVSSFTYNCHIMLVSYLQNFEVPNFSSSFQHYKLL